MEPTDPRRLKPRSTVDDLVSSLDSTDFPPKTEASPKQHSFHIDPTTTVKIECVGNVKFRFSLSWVRVEILEGLILLRLIE
jgi:hypothetical protein